MPGYCIIGKITEWGCRRWLSSCNHELADSFEARWLHTTNRLRRAAGKPSNGNEDSAIVDNPPMAIDHTMQTAQRSLNSIWLLDWSKQVELRLLPSLCHSAFGNQMIRWRDATRYGTTRGLSALVVVLRRTKTGSCEDDRRHAVCNLSYAISPLTEARLVNVKS